MRNAGLATLGLLALALAGCGGGTPPPPSAGSSAGAAPAVSASAASAAPAAESAPLPPAAPGLQGRDGELLNPDSSTMVLLYYELAGIPAPIQQWLDDDMRVRMAPGSDKPATRDLVRRELEAGVAGVRKVGTIRLTMHANLGDYDSTYEEFTVRALAPSSVVEFKAFGQNVSLKFGNARAAQTWRVPAKEAQAVRDRIGFPSDVSVDALLQIRDVHAAPEGGTITANVIEYELRENRGGTLLGRVQLGSQR